MKVGIDPGIRGGIALLDNKGKFVQVWNMPIEAKRKGGHRVDAHALLDIAREITEQGAVEVVVIESTSAMPGQGVSTMFQMGDSLGTVRVFAAVVSPRIELVHPARWKKAVGVGSNKGHSLARARQLWPEARSCISLKKDEGLAEALLIAYYGHMHL